MSFEPQGFLNSTKRKEFEAYCQGIDDAYERMFILLEDVIPGRCNVALSIAMRKLIVEAADAITG